MPNAMRCWPPSRKAAPLPRASCSKRARTRDSIELGSRKTAIKYAYARTLGGGDRLLTLVTAQPVFFLGAGAPEAKPKAGYDLGLVLLELKASGPGKGELVPAAKVRVDAQNAIVTEDYGAEMVQLTNVVKK